MFIVVASRDQGPPRHFKSIPCLAQVRNDNRGATGKGWSGRRKLSSYSSVVSPENRQSPTMRSSAFRRASTGGGITKTSRCLLHEPSRLHSVQNVRSFGSVARPLREPRFELVGARTRDVLGDESGDLSGNRAIASRMSRSIEVAFRERAFAP